MKPRVAVVGGGTAGLLAGIATLRLAPHKSVTVIRSSELGTIMVGEGTFADTPRLLHDALGVPRKGLYAQVNPVWKLGVRLLWGRRPFFDYPFSEQYDNQIFPSVRKPWGYYHLDDVELESPLVGDKQRPVTSRAGYHLENAPLIKFLEDHFAASGGTLMDDKVVRVQPGTRGVERLILERGGPFEADIYIDASGFRCELVHRALGESYVSMRDHLFCDRAVVGGWNRADEPIRPYTTMETMTSGWCWRIEHEDRINRGYVFCSAYQDDSSAASEFLSHNPNVDAREVRFVPFETRRLRRPWVGNAVAVGNACGFVEPLEATNLEVICLHAIRIAEAIAAGALHRPQLVEEYNSYAEQLWLDIRDFLALHYRFNERLDTPFWRMAVNETPLGTVEEYVKEYRSRGPQLLTDGEGRPVSIFGLDSHLALLLGLGVPWVEAPHV